VVGIVSSESALMVLLSMLDKEDLSTVGRHSATAVRPGFRVDSVEKVYGKINQNAKRRSIWIWV
jgi:hypothetical protein